MGISIGRDIIDSFLEKFQRFGCEYFGLYYGPYKARVCCNRDPEGRGRILIECPRARFPEQNASWVLPMMSGAGNGYGMFWPPEEGDYVWVFFENGDPTNPVTYMGGWFGDRELAEEHDTENDGSPKKRGFKTKGGHTITLCDCDDDERITIRHKDGTIVEWTSDGKVKVGKEGGSFEPMLKGTTVKQWLETHTHPHPWGPTSPPLQPFPVNGLSEDSETS